MANEVEEAFPVIQRQVHMGYDEWKMIVLGDRHCGEGRLQAMYAKGWEAKACREYMLDCNLYSTPKPVYQRRALSLEEVQRRAAGVMYKELAKMLARHLHPDAKAWILETQGQYQKAMLGD